MDLDELISEIEKTVLRHFASADTFVSDQCHILRVTATNNG